jgi:hypothetical protein
MTQPGPAAVRQLIDRQQIADLLTLYSRHLDEGDIDRLIRDVYTPDGIDNHGERDVTGHDDLHAWFTEVRSNFLGCRHTTTNLVITVDGDSGTARSNLTAWVWTKAKHDDNPLRPADYVIVLDYVDIVRRTEAGWRIQRRDLVPNDESMLGLGHVPGTQKGLLALAARSRGDAPAAS